MHPVSTGLPPLRHAVEPVSWVAQLPLYESLEARLSQPPPSTQTICTSGLRVFARAVTALDKLLSAKWDILLTRELQTCVHDNRMLQEHCCFTSRANAYPRSPSFGARFAQ